MLQERKGKAWHEFVVGLCPAGEQQGKEEEKDFVIASIVFVFEDWGLGSEFWFKMNGPKAPVYRDWVLNVSSR